MKYLHIQHNTHFFRHNLTIPIWVEMTFRAIQTMSKFQCIFNVFSDFWTGNTSFVLTIVTAFCRLCVITTDTSWSRRLWFVHFHISLYHHNTHDSIIKSIIKVSAYKQSSALVEVKYIRYEMYIKCSLGKYFICINNHQCIIYVITTDLKQVYFTIP